MQQWRSKNGKKIKNKKNNNKLNPATLKVALRPSGVLIFKCGVAVPPPPLLWCCFLPSSFGAVGWCCFTPRLAFWRDNHHQRERWTTARERWMTTIPGRGGPFLITHLPFLAKRTWNENKGRYNTKRRGGLTCAWMPRVRGLVVLKQSI